MIYKPMLDPGSNAMDGESWVLLWQVSVDYICLEEYYHQD